MRLQISRLTNFINCILHSFISIREYFKDKFRIAISGTGADELLQGTMIIIYYSLGLLISQNLTIKNWKNGKSL